MNLFDTHCHIHEIEGDDDLAAKWRANGVRDAGAVVEEAAAAGVNRLMVVGCTVADSRLAVAFADGRKDCHASIGVHPHEAAPTLADPAAMRRFERLAADPAVRAIGECGLDYYYDHSPPAAQADILRWQLGLARQHDRPLIFHVREAFDDFWPLFDAVPGLRGVVHSFTADERELARVLERGLYVGLNGIMTFTDRADQLAAARAVPADRLVLETDAPFLTPKPYRGKVNKPAYLKETMRFLAALRGDTAEDLAAVTTANAGRLFDVR